CARYIGGYFDNGLNRFDVW
nr:immunoglobulin heavy chain junction region [Macaca mulatta]MOY23747.1 immunoglobulin heavy chain junction region [Macaca mulatta]MOY25261.1 immunoglobulin heavy chain junction region [Macaca mulatta]MOY28475.1 immunoglobulin heavy chain junction region [Macaca mulatta]MOY28674.1 immunoglobulin heavy chain junction region [Macaca mulatta]